MMDIDEKTKCFREAFLLARTDQQLTKANIEVFKKLRGFLDDDIVDKIDNFKPGRKGILLIGDNFDLLDGIVSYIWYKHPLIYPMVGNEVTGNALRSYLAYKNAAGHKEHAISDLLFSENLLSHMHGGILFLKNINPTYTDLLERIVGTLQDVNCRPLIQEKRSRIIRHSSIFVEDGIDGFDGPEIQRREERPKFKRMPGILVMSVKNRPPEAFRRQFQEIPLDGEGERQEMVHSTEKDKGKEQKTPKGIIPIVVPGGTKWSDIEMGVDYHNEKLCIKVKGKNIKIGFLEFGLKDGRTKKNKPTNLLMMLLKYADAENNMIYTGNIKKEFGKLNTDTKRLNKLIRLRIEGVVEPPITYTNSEGFKSQFRKLYLIHTDYDKSHEVTTNKLQDIPDSNIEDNENLD